MESQLTFDFIITVGGAISGWMLKVIWDAISEVKAELRDMNKEIHQDFVRREDFSDAVLRIETMCTRIFDKLDSKQDK